MRLAKWADLCSQAADVAKGSAEDIYNNMSMTRANHYASLWILNQNYWLVYSSGEGKKDTSGEKARKFFRRR